MVKAASPIRLQDTLMKSALVSATLNHRSTAEQIEHWASLGKKVEQLLDHETVLKINAGLARICIEDVETAPLSTDAVFARLKTQHETGELSNNVTTSPVKYQASSTHPGLLQEIDASGQIRLGIFENGQFKPQLCA